MSSMMEKRAVRRKEKAAFPTEDDLVATDQGKMLRKTSLVKDGLTNSINLNHIVYSGRPCVDIFP